jgi:hypothetical protein
LLLLLLSPNGDSINFLELFKLIKKVWDKSKTTQQNHNLDQSRSIFFFFPRIIMKKEALGPLISPVRSVVETLHIFASESASCSSQLTSKLCSHESRTVFGLGNSQELTIQSQHVPSMIEHSLRNL